MTTKGNTRPMDELEGSLLPSSSSTENPHMMTVQATICSPQTVEEAVARSAAPIAIAVPVTTTDTPSTTQPSAPPMMSSCDDKAKDIRPPEAHVLPTYDTLTSSQIRTKVEEERVELAGGVARVRDEMDKTVDAQSRVAAPSRVREEDEAIRRANAVARQRDQEGVEVREDKWFQSAGGDSGKNRASKEASSSQPAEHVKYSKKGGGYEVSEYDTSDYNCREYQTDYVYKSVYDD